MGCDAEIWAIVPEKLSWQAVKKAAVRAQVALCTERILFTNPAHVPDPQDPEDTAEAGYHSIQISRLDWKDEPAPEGFTILRTNLWASYYGPKYERGSPATIIAVFRFFQHTWPKCAVYYGPDSGEKLRQVTPKLEHEMWAHLFGEHGRDYYRDASWCLYHHHGPSCEHCRIQLCAANQFKFYCLSCARHWATANESTPWFYGVELTETESDYVTPKRSPVPTIRVPVLRLAAIARQLDDGCDPRAALVDLNILLEEIKT